MKLKDEVIEPYLEHYADGGEYDESMLQAVINAYLKSVWNPIEDAPKDGTLIIIEGGTCSWSPSHAAWFSHQAQAPIQWDVTHYLDPADIIPEGEER